MKCSNCGSEISDDSTYCPKCGAKVQQESKPEEANKTEPISNNKKKSKKGLVAIGCIIASAIVIAIIVAGARGNNKNKPLIQNIDGTYNLCGLQSDDNVYTADDIQDAGGFNLSKWILVETISDDTILVQFESVSDSMVSAKRVPDATTTDEDGNVIETYQSSAGGITFYFEKNDDGIYVVPEVEGSDLKVLYLK